MKLLDPTDPSRYLDRYELIGELAAGGMATVFLGRIGGVGGFQRFVAIKRLHPHLATDEEFIEMFLDEARLAASIHHPHVVPILEVGESASGFYLVMEYIEGDTLARLTVRAAAKSQSVPQAVLLRIILDTLSGLHAAHELRAPTGGPLELVHRDVSPQNILVGVDGSSRITDFGVARASSRITSTRSDRLKGKLAYMSPEQATAGTVDRRTDVFAMGIVLWEVLAARRLFKAEHELLTLQKVTSEPIPSLRSIAPSIHPAVDQVCAKALERDVSKRFQTAADMADALERAAREAAGNGIGIASPREVAAYVQTALGEDIAIQRESIRSWLSNSEPSQSRPPGSGKPFDSFSPSRISGAYRHPSSNRIDTDSTPTRQSKHPEDEDGETQLMSRELRPIPPPIPKLPFPPRPLPIINEGTPTASIEPLSRTAPPQPRRLSVLFGVASAAALVLVGGGAWLALRSRTPVSTNGAASAAAPVPTPTVTEKPQPSAVASADAREREPVPTASSLNKSPGIKVPAKPRPGVAKVTEPPKAADPAPQAKPPEDMANPYR